MDLSTPNRHTASVDRGRVGSNVRHFLGARTLEHPPRPVGAAIAHSLESRQRLRHHHRGSVLGCRQLCEGRRSGVRDRTRAAGLSARKQLRKRICIGGKYRNLHRLNRRSGGFDFTCSSPPRNLLPAGVYDLFGEAAWDEHVRGECWALLRR